MLWKTVPSELSSGFVLNHGTPSDASLPAGTQICDENHTRLRYAVSHAAACQLHRAADNRRSIRRCRSLPPGRRGAPLRLLPHLLLAPLGAPLQTHLPQLRLLPQLRWLLL